MEISCDRRGRLSRAEGGREAGVEGVTGVEGCQGKKELGKGVAGVAGVQELQNETAAFPGILTPEF
jgi:hypothetical protein